MRKALFPLALRLLLLCACTDADPHRECKQHQDCADGEVCQFDVCVDEGSVQDNVCRTGFAFCGGECVDTQSSLETCGGCDGCPTVDHAQAVSCGQGTCQYTCSDNYRDRDDNPANGCDCPPGTDCSCIVEGPELCDLRDNDCDGVVDNVPLTDPTAEWRAHCPELPHASPNTCQAGFCTYTCDDGYADRNNPADGCECEVTPEVCDGADNDCNGIIDDGPQTDLCPALEGATPTCFGTECVYTCAEGRADVDGDLATGTDGTGCECQVSGPEICDGEDNDCDGLTDAADPDLTTSRCDNQHGVCSGATRSCANGRETPCQGEEYAARAASEGLHYQIYDGSCDRQDNDCNGQTDENCCQDDDDANVILWPDHPDEDVFWRGVAVADSDDGLHSLVAGVSSVATSVTVLDFRDGTLVSPGDSAGGERLGAAFANDAFWLLTASEPGARLQQISVRGERLGDSEVTLETAPRSWFVRLCLQPTPDGLVTVYSSGDTVHGVLLGPTGEVLASDSMPLSDAHVVDCVPQSGRLFAVVQTTDADRVVSLSHGEQTLRFGPQTTMPTRDTPVTIGNFGRYAQREIAPHTGLAARDDTLMLLRRLSDAQPTQVVFLDASLDTLGSQTVAVGDSAGGISQVMPVGPDDFLVGNHYGDRALLDALFPVPVGAASLVNLSRGFTRKFGLGRQSLLDCGVTFSLPDAPAAGAVACHVSNREFESQCAETE